MNQTFNIIVEALAVPAFIINTDHVVTAWNKACEKLTGLPASEVIGTKDAWRGFYQSKRPCLANLVIDSSKNMDELYLIHRKSDISKGLYSQDWFHELRGENRYLTCNANLILNDDGEVIGALESIQDSTESKKIEQRLVENTDKLANSNRILQATLDSIPGGVFWKDLDLNYLGANASFTKDGGLSFPNELIGKNDYDMPWNELAEHYRSDDREVLESGLAKLNIVEKLQDINGSNKWILTNKVPLFGQKNELVGILGTYADITELKAMEMKLIASKNEAEKANHAKSDFLSSMSHELRTPMNAVLGFSQLLASDTENSLSADQIKSLTYIIDSGTHLLDLINGVLDLSKIEMKQEKVHFEKISVHKVISEIIGLLTPEADSASITMINLVSKPSNLLVKADNSKLKQVFLNLISNAIKYNHKHGSISISAHITDSNTIRINVTDTGVGVSDSNLSKLFEPFNRLEHANSSILGTGIGLTISKQLIELMRGEIGARKNPEHGLTFWIELEQA